MSNNPTHPARVALITGAARRIGAAIARQLHGAGFNIVIHYAQSASDANGLCDALNEIRTNSARTLQADLLRTDAPRKIIEQAVSYWGQLDVLVNNASSFYTTPLESITEEQWTDLIGTNLKAPLFLSQAASAHLRSKKGCIVNIADIHADRPMLKHTVYSVAKSGLVALTKSLAKELAPDIRVNAVAPGAILWPELQSEPNNGFPDEDKQNILQRIPLQRCGTVTDIAKAVLFLINNSDYITGHVLPVDGGRHLTI